MLRLDHNRARSRLADHVGAPLAAVRHVSVWGNHSPTMVPDAWHATIDGRSATELVDVSWLEDELIPAVQQRGAELIEVSGASSAASAASALTDHVHDLVRGTVDGGDDWTTLGVVSRGEYGVPAGLVCGFPTTVQDGVVSVVEGLEVGEAQQRLLDQSVDELRREADVVTQVAAHPS
jgi:malate dehydrogenase